MSRREYGERGDGRQGELSAVSWRGGHEDALRSFVAVLVGEIRKWVSSEGVETDERLSGAQGRGVLARGCDRAVEEPVECALQG